MKVNFIISAFIAGSFSFSEVSPFFGKSNFPYDVEIYATSLLHYNESN